MITFTMISVLLLTLAIIITTALLIGGISVVAVLSDLLVFVTICWLAIKLIGWIRK